MELKIPKGTKDLIGPEARKKEYVEEVARKLFRLYNYQPVVTPVFEHTELFVRGIGNTTDIVQKEMYTFKDRGERSLTLRPEGTAPVVRAFITNNLGSLPKPVKLYYLLSMYRYERPQAGRMREFSQIGAEIIGSSSWLSDVEAITLCVEIFRALGLSAWELQLNSMGCPECRPAYTKKLGEFLAAQAACLCKDCERRYEENPLRAFDCKKEECKEALIKAPLIADNLCGRCLKQFEDVKRGLNETGTQFILNPRLVRGLDYYTGTTFEVVHQQLGAQNAVGGGGRYDRLFEDLSRQSLPGIGFGIGIDRTLLALEKEGSLPEFKEKTQLYLASVDEEVSLEVYKLALKLRKEGFVTELDLNIKGLKSQLKNASRLEAELTIIIGPDEISTGTVKVKKMADGTEEAVPLDRLTAYIEKFTVNG